MAVSVRLLLDEDKEQVLAFLMPHTRYAYFLSSNVYRESLTFVGRAYQADYFGAFEGGVLIGVLAHGWIGNVQTFTLDVKCIPALVEAWRVHRARYPRSIDVLLGPAQQVRAVEASMGIKVSDLAGNGDEDESAFYLELDKMVVPALLHKDGIVIRKADMRDAEQLSVWRHDFNVGANRFDAGEETLNKAKVEMGRRIEEGDIYVLEDRSRLISFCGAGGALPDFVNVGPVWTPPQERGKGYARAVTAGALLHLRELGTKKAVLFASRPDAIKVYLSLGFERIGDWRLSFLKKPRETL